MTWPEALEIVIAGTGVGRYRHLCSDANPDAESRDGYRALMLALAAGEVVRDNPPATTHGVAIGRCCG